MAAKQQQNLRSALRGGRGKWKARPVASMKQLQKVWEGKKKPSGKERGKADEDEKSGHIVAGEYKIAQFKWQCWVRSGEKPGLRARDSETGTETVQ